MIGQNNVGGSISTSLFPNIGYSYLSPIAVQNPGSGGSNLISFQVTATSSENLGYLFVDFETWQAAAWSCKVGVGPAPPYYTGGPVQAFLHDDQGNQLPGMPFNASSAYEQNRKCELLASGTSAVEVGNVWTVTFNMEFFQPYGAPVSVLVDAYDQSGNATGWLYLDGLSFSGVDTPTVSTVQVISAQGMSLQDGVQVFSVKIRDTAGGIAMWHTELEFFQGSTWEVGYTSSTPQQRCRVGAEITAGFVWVESADGEYNNPDLDVGEGPPIAYPTAGPNCTIYPQYSSFTQTGENTLEIRFGISFQSTFTGVLQDHVFVIDTLGQSHWDQIPGDPRWNWYVWPSGNPYGAPPTLPTTFTNCLTVAGSSYTLPAATDVYGNVVPYTISSTLEISQPNITISGQNGASLQRDPTNGFASASPLVVVNDNASDVTISGVTLLGNRYAVGTCALPGETTTTTTLGNCNIQSVSPPPGVGGAAQQVDLEVDGSGADIASNYFYDAPGHAIFIHSRGTTSGDGSNITVSGGEVDNSTVTGIYVDGAADPNNASDCNTLSKYQGVPGWPTNITVEGVTFRNSSTGPLSFIGGYNVFALGNKIYDHQLEPNPAVEEAGGAIVTGFCVAGAEISNNTIDDSNVGNPGALGMELHGFNSQIYNNTVTNIPGAGIYMDAVCGASVYGGSVTSANTEESGTPYTAFPYGGLEAQTGGISIQTNGLGGVRTTSDVFVWGLSSTESSSGVFFYSSETNPPPFSNVVISNSCLTPQVPSSNPSYLGVPASGVATGVSVCPQPSTQPATSLPAAITCSIFN